MKPRAVRWVMSSACLGAACILLFAVVLFAEEREICPELVERVIPITHKGVRYEHVLVIGEVPVPCEKPPSSARVETRLGDREAVDGEEEAW